MSYEEMKTNRLKQRAFLKLLEIKDSDMRVLTLFQGKTAVDKGIHIGGAFSAIVPLTALYFGDIMRYDVEQPTREGRTFSSSARDTASRPSRRCTRISAISRIVPGKVPGHDSLLNGHPGPILPGLHTATGPSARASAWPRFRPGRPVRQDLRRLRADGRRRNAGRRVVGSGDARRGENGWTTSA